MKKNDDLMFKLKPCQFLFVIYLTVFIEYTVFTASRLQVCGGIFFLVSGMTGERTAFLADTAQSPKGWKPEAAFMSKIPGKGLKGV